MRLETITESKITTLTLSEAQAQLLARTGKRLASDTRWWGSSEEGDDPLSERSVIHVTPAGSGRWNVRVAEAVGHIGLGDLQISVQPKIPTDHLLYLFEQAMGVPRIEEERAHVAEGSDLWPLLAAWFVREAEAVLRRDLMRDYQERRATLKVVRGRLDSLRTARSYYSGRLDLHCEFEEFAVDTPLNRILRAAARTVAHSASLVGTVRKRARRIAMRLEDVGSLRPADLYADTDRRTHHYQDCVVIAKHILHGVARDLEHGDSLAWTFLLRTPEMVEEGVRRVLRAGLEPHHKVVKHPIPLTNSNLTMNPDLLFGDHATADVKYKVATPEWRRSDLYQAVCFAEASGVNRAAVIDFGLSGVTSPVQVGEILVSRLTWNVNEDPSLAAERLCSRCRTWLADAYSSEAVA